MKYIEKHLPTVAINLSLILGTLSMTAIADPATELENNQWQLIQYVNTAGDTIDRLEGSIVDMRLSEGKLTGTAGCNSYFAAYSSDGQMLTFPQPIGTTMKLCPQVLMEQEQAYLGLLGKVNAYQIDNSTLVLLNHEQQAVLKFEPQRPAKLEKTQWVATGINNGQGGVVSSASTERSTAQFIDGKLSGNAGCNQYSGGYTLEDNKLTVGPIMTTRMHCPEPADIMQQEQEFLQAITGTRTLTLDTRKLELRNEEGSLQASFSIKMETKEAEDKK